MWRGAHGVIVTKRERRSPYEHAVARAHRVDVRVAFFLGHDLGALQLQVGGRGQARPATR
jgi:hypothetical protein